MSDDETPDPLAQFDQLIAGVKDWLKVVHAYYTAALAQGFDANQAMALTIAYQAAILPRTGS